MGYNAAFQYLTEPDLLSFYGWWQLSVCLFAFLALIAIWWHIGRSQNDLGQVWLALSILCWSFSGGIEVFYAKQYQQEGKVVFEAMSTLLESSEIQVPTVDQVAKWHFQYNQIKEKQLSESLLLDGCRSILSLCNSLFILMALPWFRYIPQPIEPIVKSKYWRFIVGLPFLFSLLPTINKMASERTYGLVSELDVYYAMLTLVFLGYVLWESFDKRRLPILAWLSIVCILITFAAQLYKLTDSYTDLTLLSAIFKTSLIMIFFALALSWVKELTENVIPGPEYLYLSFEQAKNESNKFEHTVILKGLPGKSERKILLTPAHFNLCLAFAKRKTDNSEDWLEIKPKHGRRSEKNYDINDHNEIKRLLFALLDGIFGKGCWTKEQHQLPLKTALFEMSDKRERKIRLRIPPDNISLTN